jgi:hypothetical protein
LQGVAAVSTERGVALKRNAWVVSLLFLAACSRQQLVGVEPNTTASPAALDFQSVFVHGRAQRTIHFTNTGGAPDTVRVTLKGDSAFSLPSDHESIGAGESVSLAVTFAPVAIGAAHASAHCEWSAGSADIPLSGTGLAWPDCSDPNPCVVGAFSLDAGACVQTPLPNGGSCADPTGCLVGAACLDGQCLGQPLNCDDGDACTTDVCTPKLGCQHLPAQDQCRTTDPCLAPSCDPLLGCQSSPVPDGTLCGTTVGCRTSGVCSSGRCVQGNAADGTACTVDWAPCATDSECHAGVCVSAQAETWTPGTVLWRYAVDAGSSLRLDAVDEAGNSYLDDYPNIVRSLDVCGRNRWTQTTSGYPYGIQVSGSSLFTETGGMVERRDTATGQSQWAVDVAQLLGACPDGGSCGATLEGGIYAGPAVLSKQGQLFIGAVTQAQMQFASISTSGQVQWATPPRQVGLIVGGANAVADRSGNFYTFVFLQSASGAVLDAFDTQGVLRFEVPSYVQRNLAVGPGYVVDLGGNPSTAWSTSGSAVYTLSRQVAGDPRFTSSGVVDGLGNLTFWPGAAWPNPGLVRIDAHGNVLASVVIQDEPYSELTLDEAGRVYLIGMRGRDYRLWVWDGVSSTLDLDVKLGTAGPISGWGYGAVWGGALLISHGVALFQYDGSVVAMFIGKHGEATQALWPRGIGGTNENRRSP